MTFSAIGSVFACCRLQRRGWYANYKAMLWEKASWRKRQVTSLRYVRLRYVWLLILPVVFYLCEELGYVEGLKLPPILKREAVSWRMFSLELEVEFLLQQMIVSSNSWYREEGASEYWAKYHCIKHSIFNSQGYS